MKVIFFFESICYKIDAWLIRYMIGEDQSPSNPTLFNKGASSLMVIQSRNFPRHAGSINTYCMQADQDKEIRSASRM